MKSLIELIKKKVAILRALSDLYGLIERLPI
jgi:hypothetical protein